MTERKYPDYVSFTDAAALIVRRSRSAKSIIKPEANLARTLAEIAHIKQTLERNRALLPSDTP